MITSVTDLRQIEIICHGNPTPQGSKKAMMPRGAKFPVVVESSGEKLKRWRYDVAQAAAAAMQQQGWDLFAGPVQVSMAFYLLRPKGHFGSGKNADVVKDSAPGCHTQKPDIDKLVRAVCDSLTGQVYRDDSQVVTLLVNKHWCDSRSRVEAWVREVVR